jgi:hypothetical protein
MMNEIKHGFTKIESVEQLNVLPYGEYIVETGYGSELSITKVMNDQWFAENRLWHSWEVVSRYIAFRHVPDTAPVAESGFEKKTEFCGFNLESLATNKRGLTATPMAQHILEAYDYIDKQAAELAQLKAAREWQPVTVETLEKLPTCLCEFKKRGSEIVYGGGRAYLGKYGFFYFLYGDKRHSGVQFEAEAIDAMFSHFRLITRAEDFTPPERRILIGDAEFSRSSLEKALREQGFELKESESQ